MEQATKRSESLSEDTIQHFVDTSPFQLEERLDIFLKHKKKFSDTSTPEVWQSYGITVGT
jgi:hypothetical protein